MPTNGKQFNFKHLLREKQKSHFPLLTLAENQSLTKKEEKKLLKDSYFPKLGKSVKINNLEEIPYSLLKIIL